MKQYTRIIQSVIEHERPTNPQALYDAVYVRAIGLGLSGQKAHDVAFYARTQTVFGPRRDNGATAYLPNV